MSEPFSYSVYHSPYVGSSVDLMLAGANARARAEEAKGQIYGRSIAEIAQIPQQLAQQKAQAQENELRRQQLVDNAQKQQQATQMRIVGLTGKIGASTKSDEEFVSGIDQAISAGMIPKDTGDHIKQSVSSGQFNRQHYVDYASQFVEPIKLGEGDTLVNPMTQAVVAKGAEKYRAPIKVGNSLIDPVSKQVVASVTPPPTPYTLGPGQIRYDGDSNPVAWGADKEKTPKSLQSRAVLVDGKPTEAAFNPVDGSFSVGGEQIDPARVKPIPPASVQAANAPGVADARKNNAEQLVIGNMPPSMLSKRATDYNSTLAEANKINVERTGKPLNIAKLQLDYEAAKKFVTGMNSTQMIRYRGLSESVVNTIDEVQRLADQLKQGGIQKWNDVKRSTIRNVYGNTPESELADQYVGAVNTLKEEFANLANGGYAPTDSAWKLANDQINADFGFKDLRASLTEVQRLINFRTAAFNDQKPFIPGQPQAAAPPSAAPIKVGGFSVVVK